MSENNSTPETPDRTPAAATPTAPTQAYEPLADTPVEKPAKRRGRTALMAGGAALGVALLVGGGVAIGASMADDQDDDDRLGGVISGQRSDGATAQGSTDAAQTGGSATDDNADDDAADDAAPQTDGDATASGEFGATTADELGAIATAAQGVAEGQPTAIDANRDGSWDVTLRGADGSETEVLVGADGQAVVRETERADADDRAPERILDAQTLDTMVAAALGEVDGRIIDIDADDDNRSPFDISILTADRQIVEITLDGSGAVIGTEIDD